jgi:hypothetical protein
MENPPTLFATSSSTVFLLSVVLLPRRGSYREPWFDIPMMASGFARRYFPNVHLFDVPLATFSFVCFFRRLCPIVGPV